MEVIGTPTPRQQDENDGSIDTAEMRRLGLHKQYKQCAVSHKDETSGDYPIYLFGEGTMILNFDAQRGGSVVLDRQEVCQLFTFFDQTHVKNMMLAILRASLIEAGHGELMETLMSMPDDHKQAVLWAFGRAEKPAFLDAPQAA
jgi:hypothetical protein